MPMIGVTAIVLYVDSEAFGGLFFGYSNQFAALFSCLTLAF
jgi:hypothetical protein